MTICPKCKGPVQTAYLFATAFTCLFVLVLMGSMIAVLMQPLMSSSIYDDIGDLPDDEYIRVYGRIVSDNDTVILIQYEYGRWVLYNHSEFELMDIDDPNTRIPVNVSMCESWTPFRNQTDLRNNTYRFYKGDNLTVRGYVKEDAAGRPYIEARSISSYYDSSTVSTEGRSMIFLSLLAFPLGSAVVIVAVIFIYLRRLKIHEQYVYEHPLTRTDLEGLDRRPPDDSDFTWHENRSFKTYKIVAIIGWGITGIIFGIILFLIYGPIMVDMMELFFFGLFGLMFPSIFSLTFTLFLYRVPTRIGLSRTGIKLRYFRDRPHPMMPTFIKWMDIKSMTGNEAGGQKVLTINKEGDKDYIMIPKDLQKIILGSYQEHKERSSIEKGKERIFSKEEIGDMKDRDLATGQIEWVRNKLSFKMVIIGGLSTLTGLIGFPIMVYFLGFPTMETFELFAYGIGMPLGVGLMVLLIGLSIALNLGFSKEGLHFKYLSRRSKPNRPEFVAWDDIEKVPPIIARISNLDRRSGESVRLFNIDVDLMRRIPKELDERYLARHPEDRPKEDVPAYSERIPNRSRLRFVVLFWFPLFLLLSFPISIGLYIFFEDSNIGFYMLMVSVLLMLPAMMIPPRYHLPSKMAPRNVVLSSEGIQADFGGKAPPPGCFSFIGWKEIEKVEALAEALPNYSRSGVLQDTKKSKVLVLVKKSGTSHILGPVDSSIIEAMIPRMGRVKGLDRFRPSMR